MNRGDQNEVPWNVPIAPEGRQTIKNQDAGTPSRPHHAMNLRAVT